jgi:hemerythrin-like metal-binding protein
MQTGLQLVDDQHSALIDELNRLIVDLTAGTGSMLLSEVLSRLGRELHEHFSFEESQLAWLGMPPHEIAEHVAAHQAILSEYTELNLNLMDHQPVTRSDVLLRIRRWVLDHIVRYDLKMRDYLPSMPIAAQ